MTDITVNATIDQGGVPLVSVTKLKLDSGDYMQVVFDHSTNTVTESRITTSEPHLEMDLTTT